jgi:hypothetical protein
VANTNWTWSFLPIRRLWRSRLRHSNDEAAN